MRDSGKKQKERKKYGRNKIEKEEKLYWKNRCIKLMKNCLININLW